MFGGRFQFTIAFLVLIVVILLYVNGAIWWSTHDTGPFIMDFFDMGAPTQKDLQTNFSRS